MIIRGYKSIVTKSCRDSYYGYFIWQHNYYEHIVRNEQELNRIRAYIKNNPSKPAVLQYTDLITFINDRPGHDLRYAINCDKIKHELGWKQRYDFTRGLRDTIAWYLGNPAWISKTRSGEYTNWIQKNYTLRAE